MLNVKVVAVVMGLGGLVACGHDSGGEDGCRWREQRCDGDFVQSCQAAGNGVFVWEDSQDCIALGKLLNDTMTCGVLPGSVPTFTCVEVDGGSAP